MYVGQHRGAFKPKYLGSGVALVAAMKKYGKAAFKLEFLEWAETKEALDDAEIKTIAAHRDLGIRLYNISAGGYKGPGFWPSGPAHQSYGKKRSQETKAKMSAAFTGRKHSQESREKIGAASRGNNHWTRKRGGFPPELRAKLTAASAAALAGKPGPRKGVTISPEQRVKMEKVWANRTPMTPEQRLHVSRTVREAWARRKARAAAFRDSQINITP
jgi:hypothetical protein